MKARDYLQFAVGLILILMLLGGQAKGADLSEQQISCMEHMSWATGWMIFSLLLVLCGVIALIVAVKRDSGMEVLRPFNHQVGRDCYRDVKGVRR